MNLLFLIFSLLLLLPIITQQLNLPDMPGPPYPDRFGNNRWGVKYDPIKHGRGREQQQSSSSSPSQPNYYHHHNNNNYNPQIREESPLVDYRNNNNNKWNPGIKPLVSHFLTRPLFRSFANLLSTRAAASSLTSSSSTGNNNNNNRKRNNNNDAHFVDRYVRNYMDTYDSVYVPPPPRKSSDIVNIQDFFVEQQQQQQQQQQQNGIRNVVPQSSSSNNNNYLASVLPEESAISFVRMARRRRRSDDDSPLYRTVNPKTDLVRPTTSVPQKRKDDNNNNNNFARTLSKIYGDYYSYYHHHHHHGGEGSSFSENKGHTQKQLLLPPPVSKSFVSSSSSSSSSPGYLRKSPLSAFDLGAGPYYNSGGGGGGVVEEPQSSVPLNYGIQYSSGGHRVVPFHSSPLISSNYPIYYNNAPPPPQQQSHFAQYYSPAPPPPPPLPLQFPFKKPLVKKYKRFQHTPMNVLRGIFGGGGRKRGYDDDRREEEEEEDDEDQYGSSLPGRPMVGMSYMSGRDSNNNNNNRLLMGIDSLTNSIVGDDEGVVIIRGMMMRGGPFGYYPGQVKEFGQGLLPRPLPPPKRPSLGPITQHIQNYPRIFTALGSSVDAVAGGIHAVRKEISKMTGHTLAKGLVVGGSTINNISQGMASMITKMSGV